VQFCGVATENQGDGTDGEFHMPTQVVLIDWLQCLRNAVSARGAGSVRLRVGVVVAAWDRVPREQKEKKPVDYIASNFPMFHNFMLSNDDRYRFECFGVSVAGGDLDNAPGFRDEYLRGSPEQAGYVVHTLCNTVQRTGDHTIPVAWAMGLDVHSAVVGGTTL
jgi:hypothetical protein